MRIKELVSLCWHFDSNVNKIKIIGGTYEVKKLLNGLNTSDVLLEAVTFRIQTIMEMEDSLGDLEVAQFGIEDGETLFIKAV